MVLSPRGAVFVGTRKEGKVYAILNHNKDNKAGEAITTARGLNMPDGALLVSDDRAGAIYRIDFGN
jgi:glucose/arabinose dehydrogenase